jgi:hypothetical protein
MSVRASAAAWMLSIIRAFGKTPGTLYAVARLSGIRSSKAAQPMPPLFGLLRKAVHVQGRGAEVVHVREDRISTFEAMTRYRR